MKDNERKLAIATLSVVGVALGWSYVISPFIDDWRTATTQVSTLSDQQRASLALVDKQQEIKAERTAIDRALSPADDEGGAIPVLLSHLGDLTEKAGFVPGSLRYVRADAYDAYAELRFELKARVSLKQLQDFLVRMAASDWFLRVHALNLTPRNDGTIDTDMSLLALSTQDAIPRENLPKTGASRRAASSEERPK